MSFESRLNYELEQSRHRENEEKAKRLENASRINTPDLSSFASSAEHPHWQADQSYVENAETNFSTEHGYHAKALETLVQFGVSQGQLLNDPTGESYVTEPVWTTRYDDIRNRIDAAATVHLLDTEEEETETELTFGLDLTTNPDPDVIRSKILIGSNNKSDLPAGFSTIKYYQDIDGRQGVRTFVPRYCIGISRESVDDYLDNLTIDRNGVPHLRRGNEPVPSFKILYEMSHQNELFEGPLYQKLDDGTITEEEQAALHRMELLDNIYIKELSRIAKTLPAYLTSDCMDKQGHIDTDKVAQKFLSGEELDQTFASIISVTEQLTNGYAESDDGTGNPDPDYLKKAREACRLRQQRRTQDYGHKVVSIASRFSA